MTLFASLAGSLAVPLLVALVYPISALLEISLSWCLVLGFPAWVIVRLLYRWSLSEGSFLQVLFRDLRPDPLASLVIGDSPLRRIPLVTVMLVGANVGLHYFVMDPLDYAMRMADPGLWVWTNVSSVFMHVDEEQLWGNMLFLWIFGSALEPRIGRLRYLAYYFFMGSAGHAFSAAFHYWVAGQDWVITLGASGAISGVMGLFVVRCYFARVGLAVPIFGALGAPLFVRYRIHVNAMVLVGLYFCMDLLGARSRAGVHRCSESRPPESCEHLPCSTSLPASVLGPVPGWLSHEPARAGRAGRRPHPPGARRRGRARERRLCGGRGICRRRRRAGQVRATAVQGMQSAAGVAHREGVELVTNRERSPARSS